MTTVVIQKMYVERRVRQSFIERLLHAVDVPDICGIDVGLYDPNTGDLHRFHGKMSTGIEYRLETELPPGHIVWTCSDPDAVFVATIDGVPIPRLQ